MDVPRWSTARWANVVGQVGAPLQLWDDQEQADQVAQLFTLDRPFLQLIPNE